MRAQIKLFTPTVIECTERQKTIEENPIIPAIFGFVIISKIRFTFI